MIALAIAGPNAITSWRAMMGPTKAYKARFSQPNSLRALFGISDTRNAFHGSDSIESVKRELEFFFPDASYEQLLGAHDRYQSAMQNGGSSPAPPSTPEDGVENIIF